MEMAATLSVCEQVEAEDATCVRRQRLSRVFQATCDGLYRFIVVRVGDDRHAADDLLQQTCHEAARSLRMPENDADCEAWLRGIARNLIRRHWRRAKRQRRCTLLEQGDEARKLSEAMESGPLPPEVLDRQETGRLVLLAVTSLPVADQRLVFAVYFQNRCQADIARETGGTVKSVEMRLYRIRDRLRAMLKNVERNGER